MLIEVKKVRQQQELQRNAENSINPTSFIEDFPAQAHHPLNEFKNLLTENGRQKKVTYSLIESSMNTSDNYQEYVEQALKDINTLDNFNYSLALRNPMLYSDELQKEEVMRIQKSERKLLLLDLDETLAHADFDKKESPLHYDTVITFKYEDRDISVGILLRPGVLQFLEEVSKHFDVAIFTASQKEYADAVLSILDPNHSIFQFRLYRDSCICVHDKTYVKDLRILKGFSLKKVVIIDNSMFSFANQLSNGILITSFYNDKSDVELSNVLIYLQTFLINTADVRIVNADFFQYKAFAESFKKSRNIKVY